MSTRRVRLRQGGLALAAAGLIVAIWVGIIVAAENQWRETRQQAASSAANLAIAFIWQVHREIQSVDQTMRVVTAQWKEDPAHFDPMEWRTRSALLSDVSEQISVMDKDGRVVSSTVAKLAGTDLHDRAFFQIPSSTPGTGLYIGPTTIERGSGRPIMTFARRLPDPDGNFVGVLVATIDTNELARTLGSVDLGTNGLVALLGPGPSEHRLFYNQTGGVEGSILGTAMLAAAQTDPQGNWIGPSALDGQERIHAFRRLSDDEPQIVVGLDYVTAMQDAVVWRREAILFGVGLTLLVLASCALLARQLEESRSREEQVGREREKLAEAYQELADAKSHADAKSNELRATIAGMSDGIMMLDGELRLAQWNQHFPDFVGVPREALTVGITMEEILRIQARAGEFGPVDETAEVNRRMALLRTRSKTGTIERTRPNGRTVELRRSALPGGGFVTLYTDITPRKQAEALQLEARRIAEQATEAKSRFVAIVSHEIRTPLNAVLNALSLLADSGLQPAQRQLADRARQAGDALLHLLNDILEMSKMDVGRLSLRPSVFALRPLLEGVHEMFRTQAAERGIALTVEMMPGAPERMRGDPGRLRQILMNLVSNAVKYTKPGRVSVLAEIVVVSGKIGLRFAVRDSGPCIPEVDAKRLFQPFVRLENAANARAGGTGLGLTICQRLAELMGGQIGLGTFEEGNEFWITLPMEAAGSGNATATLGAPVETQAPVQAAPAPPPANVAIGRRRRPPRTRILLVEDVPANQIITATMLRREGHLMDVARSGSEAIAMVQRRPYDVVLMDVFMPGMNGLEASRRIRALAGSVSRLPIVAVTANVSLEDRAACLESGMNDMLAKPVRTDQLQDALLRHVWPVHAAQVSTTAGTARATPDGPRLDVGRINDLRNSLPPATFPSMVENCLSDLHQRMPELRHALSEGSPPAIESVAHAMAGVAGTYGLIGMRRRLGHVVQAARSGDQLAANNAAKGIEGELERTTEAMRAFVLVQAA